jgi:hypothetical protein
VGHYYGSSGPLNMTTETANGLLSMQSAMVTEISDESALDQLLKEVLDPSDDEQSFQTLYSNASMNAQLVQLVMRALTSSGSIQVGFGRSREQTIQCLRTVTVSIERTPRLLFEKVDPAYGDAAFEVVFWLVNKISYLMSV